MRALLAAALLLTPAPALAQGPDADDCALLQRIAAAAAEPTPFASLAGANLYALLGNWCRVDTPAPRSLMCSRSLTPEEYSEDAMIARIQRCLPGTEIVPRLPWESTRLRNGQLRIDVNELGGPRAKVGRIVTLYLDSLAPE